MSAPGHAARRRHFAHARRFASQTVDPTLILTDLPGLASRLSLPSGWSYEVRTPTTSLIVDTTGQDACVTQDDFANSYSLQN